MGERLATSIRNGRLPVYIRSNLNGDDNHAASSSHQ
jgi:hypothetical protein